MIIAMRNSYWLLIALLIFGLQACLRPVDGCINPRAKNFDPEADRNTTCDYYDIYFDMSHLLKDTVPMTDSTLILDMDSLGFYVEHLYFFLHKTHLTRLNETSPSISISEITYQENGNTLYEEDNVAIFSFLQSSTQACDWTNLGNFNTLDVLIGLPADIQTTEFLGLDTDHEFSTSSPLQGVNGLISASIQLIRSDYSDTIQFQSDQYIPYSTSINRSVVDGSDLRLSCALTYKSLLSNISIINDDSTLVGEKLLQNIQQGLFIE